MTLGELFAALQNSGMVITVIKDNTEQTKIYVSGYDKLQASILAEEVSKITVQNQNAAVVELVGSTSA